MNNEFKLPKKLISNDDLLEMKDLAEIQIIGMKKLISEKSFPKRDEDLKEYRNNLIQQIELKQNEQSTNHQ